MDVHDNTSTIREAFEFSALLRQDAATPRQMKLDYVNLVLDTLELNELQDAVIGTLPLEQKRRTTIGVELCAKPSLLLFLDEPTSVRSTSFFTLAMKILTLIRYRVSIVKELIALFPYCEGLLMVARLFCVRFIRQASNKSNW